MTEQEFMASEDPQAMLQAFGPLPEVRRGPLFHTSARKLRLFACACAIKAYGFAHATAMGPGKGGYGVWYETGEADPNDPEDTDQSPSRLAASWARRESNQTGVEGGVTQAEKAALLRCIVGNPFRPTFTLAKVPAKWGGWLTPTALAIAADVYEDRNPWGALDPVRLSILADALADAGCEDEALLTHLRSPAPHVRGCWALDLLLGRQ